MEARIEKMLIEFDYVLPAFADVKKLTPTGCSQEILAVDEGESFAHRPVLIRIFHDITIVLF